jgi:hypothetical protein
MLSSLHIVCENNARITKLACFIYFIQEYPSCVFNERRIQWNEVNIHVTLYIEVYAWMLIDVSHDPLGNPKRRYDEHNSKFSLIIKPKFNRPIGERNHFWRLLLADFGRAHYRCQQ